MGKVHTHNMFISSKDDLGANPPHRSVSSIMDELGHTHIDILKVRDYFLFSLIEPILSSLTFEPYVLNFVVTDGHRGS